MQKKWIIFRLRTRACQHASMPACQHMRIESCWPWGKRLSWAQSMQRDRSKWTMQSPRIEKGDTLPLVPQAHPTRELRIFWLCHTRLCPLLEALRALLNLSWAQLAIPEGHSRESVWRQTLWGNGFWILLFPSGRIMSRGRWWCRKPQKGSY